MISHMRSAIVKRVLTELGKKADKAPDEFRLFWENFGPVIKEGLYEDFENRETIQKIVRFHSTTGGDDLISLEEYVGRMKEGQETIYYISGRTWTRCAAACNLKALSPRGSRFCC